MTDSSRYDSRAFDYAIQRPDGKRYDGSVHGDDRDWTDSPVGSATKQGFFAYTEAGAHKKVAAFPVFFADCQVVRISG